MNEDVRAELQGYFAPQVAELEGMLGRTFPWSGK